MYGGNFYYPYQMMPGMNGMPTYPPQLPLQNHPTPHQYSVPSPTSSKVKITDKDGKHVDLEGKGKFSASNLANSSPVPASSVLHQSPADQKSPSTASVSTSPSSAPNTLAANQAPPADPSTGKLSAAEEFRRKILEKAQIAKNKKAAESAKAASADAKSETPKNVPAAAPVTETAKSAESTVQTAQAPNAAAEASTAIPPAVPENESAKGPEQTASNVSEKALSEHTATPTASEPIEEVEPVEKESPKEPNSEPAPKPSSESAEPAETTKEVSAEPTSTADTSAAEIEGENDHDSDSGNESNDESKNVEQEKDSLFDLSMYFDKLTTASPLEDPFSVSYPYPLAGVDPRWKSETKKYRYDPQFLLQFRDVVQYPIDDAWKEKLESLGIVPNKRLASGPQRMNSNKFSGSMQGGRFNGAMPGRLGQFDGRQNSRSGSKRRGGSSAGGPRDKSLRNRTQSKRGGKDFVKEDELTIPKEEIKPLVASSNRWVPKSRQKPQEQKLAPDGSVLLSPEDVERKTKSALNKLTLEMFDPITEELLKIGHQSIWEEDAHTIKQVISLTFAKACDEPYWSTVYAQFCAKMLKDVSEDIKDVNTLSKSGEVAHGGDFVRRVLLATCQSEYEKGWVDKLPTNEDGSPLEPEMMSDEYYAMAAAKRRGLGLVKFIGNLYILNMLNDQVILHCLRDQSKNVVDPSEDSLENLAQLIKTVGPRFEASERNKAALTLVYDNIQQILDNCKLSSRIKFMLMDLQDLRRAQWKSMKQESGPKTIKEIHNEAELKRIEESRASAEKRRQNKGSYNSGFQGGDSRSNSKMGSSWGNRKDSRQPVKDSRGFMSISRNQSNRPARDNSTPAQTRENSKRAESVASNIFAALGGDHDDGEAAN